MGFPSARNALRELLHSRSAAASALRVCVLVVLAQGALVVVRAPFAARPNDLLVSIDTDDRIRWRNDTHVNAKALVTLLADVVKTLSLRVAEVDKARLQSQEGADLLKRISDDEYWAVKRTLEAVLPEAAVIGDDVEPSDRPGAAPLQLPTRYRPDVHKIVMFDQWLPAADLTVWVSPLGDSAQDVVNLRLQQATLSVCVSYRGHPHLAVLLFREAVHWGLYARGNDLDLRVAEPMRPFPERLGVATDSPAAAPLVRKAFFDDADVYIGSSVNYYLMASLAGDLDVSLLTGPVPRRALCAGHAMLRLYGGKVTDLAGREVEYPASGGDADGGIVGAIYYHKRLLQQVVDAKAGRTVARDAE